MKTSSPFCAPQVPPVTGASRKSTPRSAQAAATFRARSGETVLESISVAPWRRERSGFEQYFFERRGIADDGDQHVGLRGYGARIGGGLRARCYQWFRFGLRSVPDCERKSRLEQVQPHWAAHEAESD
jgi:hypothetical protein